MSFRYPFKASFLNYGIYIMPYSNEFLGGRPINRSDGRYRRGSKSIEYLGPLLRFGGIDVEHAETYLLDGTFL